ncbi:MAG: hypothetical protein KME46_25855 [Brasilonema angustatum HA4187-MV1]|jgi:hypothetical protein|nr:hypothetical protein [Brasilonema angustatum HA4187-MV1]
MPNKNPETDHLPKNYSIWRDAEGKKVDTKTMRFPAYLEEKLRAIALKLHAQEIAKQKAEQAK